MISKIFCTAGRSVCYHYVEIVKENANRNIVYAGRRFSDHYVVIVKENVKRIVV
jgi:hypothetical protein